MRWHFFSKKVVDLASPNKKISLRTWWLLQKCNQCFIFYKKKLNCRTPEWSGPGNTDPTYRKQEIRKTGDQWRNLPVLDACDKLIYFWIKHFFPKTCPELNPGPVDARRTFLRHSKVNTPSPRPSELFFASRVIAGVQKSWSYQDDVFWHSSLRSI